MGTRSLTHIHEDDGSVLLTFYKQHDGYPSGWGKELAEFLAPISIVNGLSGDGKPVANGMGCLAAQILAHFKDGPGQFYVYPANASDCGEDYTYHIELPDDAHARLGFPGREGMGVVLRVLDGTETIFTGSPADFPALLAKLEAAQEA
jgi:hypothetical protein